MLQKSPSGSLCPYYYKGGELHPLHYGSYHRDFGAFQAVVEAEEAFILAAHGGRKVWVDLYETRLDRPACALLAGHFAHIQHKIFKLALVGCPRGARWTLDRLLAQAGCKLPHRYFDDPEFAKDWLVGEGA